MRSSSAASTAALLLFDAASCAPATPSGSPASPSAGPSAAPSTPSTPSPEPTPADPLADSYLYYVYTDQEVMGSVVIDASGEGDWPLPPGEYDAHYLLDDGYTSLAVAPFTVTD